MSKRAAAALALTALFAATSAEALSQPDVWVQRLDAERVLVAWRDAGPLDVYVGDRPSAQASEMRLAANDDRDGHEILKLSPGQRPYFLLKSEATGETLRVAERLLPLEGGSNFRDVGGYAAADGRRVRWGQIYRSGAMPKLTDADYAYLDGLGVKVTCDLRTVEERQLAPHAYKGAKRPREVTIDYPAAGLFGRDPAGGLYATGHHMLKRQYKAIFEALLAGEAPLAYNCSAGQDRTGIATALILTALGTPRDVILEDYHLSTAWRRPQFERLDLDYAKLAETNPVARFYVEYGRGGTDPSKPRPLYAADGEAQLSKILRAIDTEYGSVLGYLDKELGVDAADVARLRALYTE